MNLKKLTLALVALVIALAAVGGNWAIALADEGSKSITEPVSFQKAADIFLRKAGVYMPSSNYTGKAVLTRIEPTGKHADVDLTFVAPLLDFTLLDPDGDEFEIVWGINYIYFNLDSEARADWDDKELSIYRYDPGKDDWIVCPSFLVRDDSAKHGRLTCIINKFGLYALAREK
jgi:hypothetical protein